MARPSVQPRKFAAGFRASEATPGISVEPTFYFAPPRGLNTLASINRLPTEFSPYMKNLVLDQGKLVSRLHIQALGEAAANTLMATFSFKAPDSSGRVFRLLVSEMHQWNGIAWYPVIGVAFTGSTRDRFTWTAFGNELLICNGVDKVVAFNVLTGVAEVLEESFPCQHLSTFNNRVFASAVVEGPFMGHRVRWSVKNDHRDWTSETTTDGVGAGYEDLLGGTAGQVDQLMGVFPLTDDVALMVREKSLWNTFVTGDVQAPHRFSRITTEVGSRARHSIQRTPHGIVMLSQEDVIVANQSGFQSIGEPIRRELLRSITDFKAVSSVYNPEVEEYRLIVGARVWRFNFREKGWTRDEYPFELRDGSYFDYQSLGLTFDELEGTFDSLSGTFDEQVRHIEDKGVHFVVPGQELVVGEDAAATTDLGSDSSIEIQTGMIQSASLLDETELIEAQLEYEAGVAQTLFFEYTNNNGIDWTTYSFITVQPTNGPDVLRVTKTLTHRKLQIRVRAANLGQLTLHSLALFINKAPRTHP